MCLCCIYMYARAYSWTAHVCTVHVRISRLLKFLDGVKQFFTVPHSVAILANAWLNMLFSYRNTCTCTLYMCIVLRLSLYLATIFMVD